MWEKVDTEAEQREQLRNHKREGKVHDRISRVRRAVNKATNPDNVESELTDLWAWATRRDDPGEDG